MFGYLNLDRSPSRDWYCELLSLSLTDTNKSIHINTRNCVGCVWVVGCEIVNDDGSMMRLPELLEFAKQHKIKLTTIDKLISYVEKHS